MRKAMHLSIKNDEAHRLATEFAKLTGESRTSAVTLALRERLARECRRRRTDRIATRLMEIGSQYAALANWTQPRPRQTCWFQPAGGSCADGLTALR
jgi:antitoxin VapB